jgi:hypothetical protein
MRKNAYLLGREMIWNKVAQQYSDLCRSSSKTVSGYAKEDPVAVS